MSDTIKIEKNVFVKIIEQIIIENDNLLIDSNPFKKFKNAIDVKLKENDVDIELRINIKQTLNINDAVEKLRNEIIIVLEQLTDYTIKSTNINIIGLEQSSK